MTWCPRSSLYPFAKFFRTFQSNAAFRAFSTAERAPVDEEEIGQGLRHGDPREGLDELGHLDRVEIGVRGLRDRHLADPLVEILLEETGMVVPQGVRGEEREEIEVLLARGLVDHERAVALVHIEHEGETVHEHMPGEGFVDFRRGDLHPPFDFALVINHLSGSFYYNTNN